MTFFLGNGMLCQQIRRNNDEILIIDIIEIVT